jgi:hypothetical protein
MDKEQSEVTYTIDFLQLHAAADQFADRLKLGIGH